MFLWAAGEFDRQGMRLTGSASEHYHQIEHELMCACNVHVCVCTFCARVRACVRVTASASANMS